MERGEKVCLAQRDIYKCSNQGRSHSSSRIYVSPPAVAYDDVTSHPKLCSVKIPYYGTCLYTLGFSQNYKSTFILEFGYFALVHDVKCKVFYGSLSNFFRVLGRPLSCVMSARRGLVGKFVERLKGGQ